MIDDNKKVNMGIKNLNKLLAKYSQEAYLDIPISSFHGKRIAIDASNWLHISWATAYKEVVNSTDVCMMDPSRDEAVKVWIRQVQRFIKKLLYAGITPIFVVDGKHPEEKKDTQQKRRDNRSQLRSRLAELKKTINEMNPLERTTEVIESLRKLYRQDVSPSFEETKTLKNILSAIGIPFLEAVSEAERLCAMLCVDHHVDAVLSTDTDTLTYGCPLVLTGFTKAKVNQLTGKKEEHFTAVDFNTILSKLGIDHQSFVDLCILCGCDYNTNIPKIGALKAYTLIQKHQTIDNLPNNYDRTCLNYSKCRELFSYQPSQSLSLTPLQTNINMSMLISSRERLQYYGIEDWIDELLIIYTRLPTPQNRLKIAMPTSPVTLLSNLKVINENKSKEMSTNNPIRLVTNLPIFHSPSNKNKNIITNKNRDKSEIDYNE